MSFSRKDIKDFIQNFREARWSDEEGGPKLLSECGCVDSDYGIGDSDYMTTGHDLASVFEPHRSQMAASAPCPDSYNKSIDVLVMAPKELIDMLKPLMDDLGIGCPASLAKAMADVLTVSQENEITPVFKVNDI
jgi:hypothetical protein